MMKSSSNFFKNDFETSPIELTATDLLEYIFCPRFTYFELYLKIPQHEEKRYKVEKGRTVHEQKNKINPQYLRKKIECTDRKFSVYIDGLDGCKGIVDEVLTLADGTMAPLDYKYAEYKETTFRNHRLQLVYYAKLIKSRYGKPVNRGFIIYTRSKNKIVEVPIHERDFNNLESTISEMFKIITTGKYPEPTAYRTACFDCCYKNICEGRV